MEVISANVLNELRERQLKEKSFIIFNLSDSASAATADYINIVIFSKIRKNALERPLKVSLPATDDVH